MNHVSFMIHSSPVGRRLTGPLRIAIRRVFFQGSTEQLGRRTWSPSAVRTGEWQQERGGQCRPSSHSPHGLTDAVSLQTSSCRSGISLHILGTQASGLSSLRETGPPSGDLVLYFQCAWTGMRSIPASNSESCRCSSGWHSQEEPRLLVRRGSSHRTKAIEVLFSELLVQLVALLCIPGTQASGLSTLRETRSPLR